VSYSVHVFEDAGAGWRWHLKAGNGRTMATSGESYASAGNARRAARRMIATLRVPVTFHVDAR
jgi:uncharacterized protein YegP (UPF0339 family)